MHTYMDIREEMHMSGLNDEYVEDTAIQLEHIYNGLISLRRAGYRIIMADMPFGIHPPHLEFVQHWITTIYDKIEQELLGDNVL